jgi:recombination protein RecT
MAETSLTRPSLVAPRGNKDLTTLPIAEAIEAFTPQFSAALPDNIPVAKFKRVLVTALNQNKDLSRCDRHSLFLAAVKCAQDGLYPDGREAALVPFKATVQYMPMVTGLRRLMASEVIVATTEVVYANDKFRYVLGDDAAIEHEPPSLDQDRGPPIGAYCSIKLRTGGHIREVMSKAEIERIRITYSKATRDDAPWNQHWGEMARKTVLKRAAKQVAFSPEIAQALAREDDGASVALVIDHDDLEQEREPGGDWVEAPAAEAEPQPVQQQRRQRRTREPEPTPTPTPTPPRTPAHMDAMTEDNPKPPQTEDKPQPGGRRQVQFEV